MRSKKIWLVLGLVILVNLVLAGMYIKLDKEDVAVAYNPNNLIRFHVLANSDTEEDQALKRAVRDRIVQEMTPRLDKAKNVEEAKLIARENLGRMETIAAEVIKENHKNYPVKAMFGEFPFPTKSYGSLTLPAGMYEAVRVVIGKGEGANWWCVLFPPLCFVSISESLAVENPDTVPVLAGESKRQKVEIKFKIVETFKKLGKSKKHTINN